MSDTVYMARNQRWDSPETQDRSQHDWQKKKKIIPVNEMTLNYILLYLYVGT